MVTRISVYIFFVFVLCFVGCSQESKDPGPPYVVRVVSVDPSLPLTSQGIPQFVWADRKLSGLRSLENLQGEHLALVRGGRMSLDLAGGSLATLQGFSGGQKPQLRYTVSNGVVVPQDYNSLAMLSSYALFEKMLDDLQEKTNIPPSEILAQAPNQKLKVFFEPAIQVDMLGLRLSATQKLNAAYLTGLKQFVLFQRSAIEEIPLSMNLQVIAHEFGHALFEHTFYKNKVSGEGFWENSCAMRGVNEGFADFFSYKVTGSTNVLRGSFDIRKVYEERDFSNLKFNYSQTISSCNGGFYCIGTVFAGALREMDSKRTASAKPFLVEVMAALGNAKKNAEDLPVSSAEDLSQTLLSCQTSAFTSSGVSQSVSLFLAGFVRGLSPADVPLACTVFSDPKWFGELGFSSEYKNYVCP